MQPENCWVYNYEKILAERAIADEPRLQRRILRSPTVYAPGHCGLPFYPYIKRMHDSRSFIMFSEEQASWKWIHGYVENVASAIAHAALVSRAAGMTYNLGEKTTQTTLERIQKIAPRCRG
jgi:nucleoside-diphosphate-sugar epimerase